jgi:two-component system, LytTR family, response regulator
MSLPTKTSPRSVPTVPLVHGRQTPGVVRHLLLKSEGRLHCVRIDEIDWCEAAGNYVQLHLGARTVLIRRTLSEMSGLLGVLRFTRISRTTIVNLDRIIEVKPTGTGGHVVLLKGGRSRRLTRGFRSEFMERFFVL